MCAYMKQMPRLCRHKHALGVPREGFHRLRIPGTDTAALDFCGTLAIAWAASAASGARLSHTCVAVFLLAEFLHWLFCVFE